MRILLLLLLFPFMGLAQNCCVLKVHFLYGSRACHKYKGTEYKSFGGIKGGHVGIEGSSGQVISFVADGRLHWFARRKRHSKFEIDTVRGFYAVMSGNYDSVKRAVIRIPVTERQMQVFDSLSAVYTREPPYDYAFIGMRCASAAYDLLAQMGIMDRWTLRKTRWAIFYPKKLRTRLLGLSLSRQWKVETAAGSPRRKWEKDKIFVQM